MANEKLVESILDKTRPGWRERKAKQKSPWDLFCLLIGFCLTGAYWYLLWQGAWYLHVLIHPEHAGQQGQFWQDGISTAAFIPSFLMAMPLGLPALFAGLLSGNCVVWLIPPARRAMEKEAKGDYELSFKGANAGLIKWGLRVSAVALALSLIGIVTLKSLR